MLRLLQEARSRTDVLAEPFDCTHYDVTVGRHNRGAYYETASQRSRLTIGSFQNEDERFGE
jgi:hypothetical protein